MPITTMIRAATFFDIIGGLVIRAGLNLLLPMAGLA